MSAVILRDMRTRFDVGNALGFVLAVLWPLGHMGVLILIYNALGRGALYGESLDLFVATGIVPALGFSYISRNIAFSVNLNRPMLSFPVVKVPDIMYGRAVLEIIGMTLSIIAFCVVLIVMGDNIIPANPAEATFAIVSVFFAAVGFGILAAAITFYLPFFGTVYALLTIVSYILSGTLFISSNMPHDYKEVLSWIPSVHAVEWMRSAYFPDYPSEILDKAYLWKSGFICIFLGLSIERLFRPMAK